VESDNSFVLSGFFCHETLTPIREVSSQESICQILPSLGVYTLIINVAVNLKFVSRLRLIIDWCRIQPMHLCKRRFKMYWAGNILYLRYKLVVALEYLSVIMDRHHDIRARPSHRCSSS